jgi:hypothetical protein
MHATGADISGKNTTIFPGVGHFGSILGLGFLLGCHLTAFFLPSFFFPQSVEPMTEK